MGACLPRGDGNAMEQRRNLHEYAWGVRRPHVAADLPGGIYALEHFDGVERLTATFRVPRQSFILLLR